MIKITELAHRQIAAVVAEGHVAVDATAGAGKDTLVLARLVGPGGRVYAFDIQQAALRRTEARLKESGLADRVELINDGHERMAEYVTCPVSAVVFNLGYLPGGDKNLVTVPDTTLAALRQALVLLRPGGLAALVTYPGHAAGKIEQERLIDLCRALNPHQYGVLMTTLLNREHEPPALLTITRFS